MSKNVDDDPDEGLKKYIFAAHARSFQIAFETAVRTGTALIYARDIYAREIEIVRIYPPYRYELVPLKPTKKKTIRKKK